jgi:2-iminobutanoate/2-iminopropanoate deaminase
MVIHMSRKIIQTENAPKAIGPYSQGIAAQGNFVFVSGQIGVNPATGEFPEGGIEAQARQSLENLKGVLEAAGSGLAQVVKTTVLLHDINDYATVNSIYAEYFTENPPARAAFGGLDLPKGALVEIECIALIQN